MTRTATLLAALALAACQPEAQAPAADSGAAVQPPATPATPPATNTPAEPKPAPEPTQASDDWRDHALPADVDRLERLEAAWDRALRRAWEEGHGADITKLRALTDPDAMLLDHPQPPPGDYDCSVFKLGGSLGFVSYPAFRCRIELTPGGDLTLTKLTGSQRTAGKFYPYGARRLVYLGGQAWGSQEAAATDYGENADRDQIGVLERIGENHWRLVLPWPRVESDLDILELTR